MDSERLSPTLKSDHISEGRTGLLRKSVSVEARDSLAELRGHVQDGSLTFPLPGHKTWTRADYMQESASDSHADCPATNKASYSNNYRHSPSSMEATSSGVTDNRKSSKANEELGEEERRKWMAFRQRKKTSRVVGLHSGRRKQPQLEPIVLSSEEDEQDEGDESSQMDKTGQNKIPHQFAGRHSLPRRDVVSEPPSFLELDFLLLHCGLTRADANGKMMITSSGILLPLKGKEEGEVSVVASQVRGYGLWDGDIVRGGTLLDELEGLAHSLLILWVTDAQANMLQREMAILHNSTAKGPACFILLLVMTEQLSELQAALLASMLEMTDFREGRASSAEQPTSPLDWSDGQLLLQSCPPPLDEHLLDLLGQLPEVSSTSARQGIKQSSALPFASRLIQYPAAPSRGRITVTKEDLSCLERGEFLNDVIIDFYLKFLLLEGGGCAVAERSHIFSSFFFKQLSRRQVADERVAAFQDPYMRHQRVKTWTRHVDIFNKDFLFVPINQDAHWFLAVVCFPGQDGVHYEQQTSTSRLVSLRSEQPPACTQQGCTRNTVLTRPCILVMDSLKLLHHEHVCKLLRDYLQVEWEERRELHRVFSSDNMHNCSCIVPQQDNSTDCGLYLLQYVESFLQNPVVHFDLPPHLVNWFPRHRVRQKREEIRSLIMRLHKSQSQA
ncbi:sentrin-specific protease 7-like isoform X1 [Nerophis lumbriciformis]|uniref:sentrin-specific protease 7-like isoform X1 n=2 Tax=Nerophis lumbriciformis TaxID=546530 RepID=UPI002ADF6485|nr:sentrin-specific protease 7-like isoform X1 [Nerophis lumbriciformis]XP_061834746.1 sentrin-specific protease 7-like isoform X1 [Nerophis lumbriciformis]XP_061834754.1 sentrin-specific protease 7-like isoform X1 [Nerophis lumbriciformis]XP_061834762.1 sentrin-specific protease 7-like isoform X1 [Nerophis lumbriciformis]XP_061834770.1 sentrin-specific protease 7-like isoform X1 [Nerophis lumbriciformis]